MALPKLTRHEFLQCQAGRGDRVPRACFCGVGSVVRWLDATRTMWRLGQRRASDVDMPSACFFSK